MAAIALVAHSRKSLGGGLPQLREILAWEGVTDPLWYEVSKSRRAPGGGYGREPGPVGPDVRPARSWPGRRVPLRQDHAGENLRIRFGQKVRYELDGGARPASKKLRIKVHPGSLTVCVPSGHRE